MLSSLNGTTAPAVQTLDPELSFIASQAAIELDNLLVGKPGQLDAVGKLAAYLQGSTSVVTGTTERRSLMDPQTIDVVSRAIDASGNHMVKTLGDLTSEAWRIAGELGATKGDSGQEQIQRLRSFCVALTRVATAQRQAMNDMQPSHPFRR